ncbi:MAG: zf-HC2 domain-containing protein [Acidobacteriia bacterium]|nr:zf-HC2 domain-containing protein [Terriglobia bacterium]
MPCSSPERELLTFWLAGSLDAGEAERVARHVAMCDSCRSDAANGRTGASSSKDYERCT